MFPANVCSSVFTIPFQGSVIKVRLITTVQNSVREYKCEEAAEKGRNRERKKFKGGGERNQLMKRREGKSRQKISTVFNLEFKRKSWNTINLIHKLFHWKFFHSFPLSLSLVSIFPFSSILFSSSQELIPHPTLAHVFLIRSRIIISFLLLFLLPFFSFSYSVSSSLTLSPVSFSNTLSSRLLVDFFLLPTNQLLIPAFLPSFLTLSRRLFFLFSVFFLSQMRHFLKEGK